AGLDAAQRFLYVLGAVGVAEAQVAFAPLAEGGARKAGDAGLVEQAVGERFRRVTRGGDVREDVEGALRPRALDAWDLAQAVHDDVAPLPELRDHRVDRRVVALQRLGAGQLREATGAG